MGMTPDLIKLRELAGKATAGPWLYRPNELDDWGWVRTESVDDDGFRCLIASCKAGRDVTDHEMNEHRRCKTDPFGPNAQYIAASNPTTIIALIDALEDAHKRIAELEITVEGLYSIRQARALKQENPPRTESGGLR